MREKESGRYLARGRQRLGERAGERESWSMREKERVGERDAERE